MDREGEKLYVSDFTKWGTGAAYVNLVWIFQASSDLARLLNVTQNPEGKKYDPVF